jgi:hypothetical protein
MRQASISPPAPRNMPRIYQYIGPPEIAERTCTSSAGRWIASLDDVRAWLRETRQENRGGLVVVTFVIDIRVRLLIADRRSEHVACAGGGPVRSAGEMTFAVGAPLQVASASNQSTGFCPEPESWPAVSTALSAAGFAAPAGFDPAYHFRRCSSCRNITLVKNAVFECGICGVPLPTEYNLQ